MQKIKCMKELALFATLDFTEREKIGVLAGKKVYRKNEIIFRDGDPAHTIYLIKYGRVRLFKVSEGGKEITLDILKEDDIFGENTFFEENARHTMNARAMEDTFICSCNKEHFAILLQNPQTALKIIQLLGSCCLKATSLKLVKKLGSMPLPALLYLEKLFRGLSCVAPLSCVWVCDKAFERRR